MSWPEWLVEAVSKTSLRLSLTFYTLTLIVQLELCYCFQENAAEIDCPAAGAELSFAPCG